MSGRFTVNGECHDWIAGTNSLAAARTDDVVWHVGRYRPLLLLQPCRLGCQPFVAGKLWDYDGMVYGIWFANHPAEHQEPLGRLVLQRI